MTAHLPYEALSRGETQADNLQSSDEMLVDERRRRVLQPRNSERRRAKPVYAQTGRRSSKTQEIGLLLDKAWAP